MSNDDAFTSMTDFLQEQDLGHLGLTVDGEVYVVPINYTYSRGRILLHCALEGRKLDMIRANPRVCFTVSRQDGLPVPHAGDACDLPWRSVMCWGRARVVDDLAERCETLTEFQARYSTPSKPRAQVPRERAERCGAIEIVVDRMTGRTPARDGDPAVHLEWEATGAHA